MERIGGINVYRHTGLSRPTTCPGMVTINLANGVTPMFVQCPSCADDASSRAYHMGAVMEYVLEQEDTRTLDVTHAWYRPDDWECLIRSEYRKFVRAHSPEGVYRFREARQRGDAVRQVTRAVLTHLAGGGLMLAPIAEAVTLQMRHDPVRCNQDAPEEINAQARTHSLEGGGFVGPVNEWCMGEAWGGKWRDWLRQEWPVVEIFD